MNRNYFKLTKMCGGSCPFGKQSPQGMIRRERAEEIAQSINNGSSFQCHKTVEYTDDEDQFGNQIVDDTNSAYCAGAILVQENQKQLGDNLSLARALGLYNPDKMTGHDEAFMSFKAFIDYHAEGWKR